MNDKSKVAASYLILYLVWGANPFFIGLSVRTIPVEVVLAFRFTVSGIFFIVYSIISGGRPVFDRRKILSAMLLSVLLLMTGNGMVTLAHRFVYSHTASLILSTIPLCIAVFDRLLYRIPTSRFSKIGIALGILGVGLLLYVRGSPFAGLLVWGNIFVLVGVVSWALAMSIGKKLPLYDDPFLNAGIEMLFCGVVATIFVLIRFGGLRSVFADTTAESAIGLAYITVMGGFAFAVFNYLVRVEPSVRVSSYTLVNPVVATIIGVGIGHEIPSRFLVPAIVVILSGVVSILYGDMLWKKYIGRI